MGTFLMVLCPVCRTSTDQVIRRDRDGTPLYFVCASCGLWVLRPQAPLPAYDNAYYGRGAGSRWIAALSRPLLELDFYDLGLSRLPRGSKVLDIGCGAGALVEQLDRRGWQAFGLDTSASAIALARVRVPRAVFACATLEQAPWPEASLDALVSTHVLEHVDDPLGWARAALRLVRPGGRLVLRVPHAASWESRLAGSCWFHLDFPFHVTHWNARALRHLLTAAGWTVRQIRPARFEYKQTLLYSVAASLGLSTEKRGTRLACLPLQVFAMPIAVLLSFLGSGGTLQITAERPS